MFMIIHLFLLSVLLLLDSSHLTYQNGSISCLKIQWLTCLFGTKLTTARGDVTACSNRVFAILSLVVRSILLLNPVTFYYHL